MRRAFFYLIIFMLFFDVAHAARDELLVTSRGRSEDVLRVPDTITLFSADDLQRAEIRKLDDLIARTPGVHIINDQDPGTNLITIRGVSTNRQQAPSIAYVVDGVQLADTEFFTGRLMDVARVEVLKGPQGALYGRSAIAGVIKVDTQAPTEDFSGYVEAGIGNGPSWLLGGAVSGPIIEDKLLFRVAAQTTDTDGFIRNTFLDKKVDYLQSHQLRAKLKALPSDNLTMELRFNLLHEDGGAAYISSNNVTGLNDGRLAGEVLSNPFGDFEGRADRDWWGLSFEVNFDPSFGGTFTSITAYDNYRKFFIEELDFRNDTPLTFFGDPVFPDGLQPIAQPVQLKVFTQEVRYTSPSDKKLRYIIGLFFQDISRDRTDDFGPLLFGGEAPVIATDSQQFAIFAQASYDITDALELTLALRYDRDKRSELTFGLDSNDVFSDRADTFDKFQPKVSLAWQVSDDHLIYGTYALGFKTGGFNALPTLPGDVQDPLFPSEQTQAFEFGAKSAFLDGRLTIDLALFYTKYENFQNTIFLNGRSVVLSVDKVDVLGAEMGIHAQITDGFSLYGSFAYTDSEIQDYQTPNPLTGMGLVDYSGRQTPNSPKFTLDMGAQYSFDVGSTAVVTLRLDYHRQGVIFYEIDNVLRSPAHGWADAGVDVVFDKGVTAAFWIRNLTDERWGISAFGQGQILLLAALGPNGPFDSFTINKGRQWGFTLRADF